MPPAVFRPCVFFDRDGVVNQSPGPGYVNRLEDFHILPGFVACVRAAAAKGLPAVVVTNQRGVERGLTPPGQLAAMHRRLRDELARAGLELLDLLVCTANDDAHPDRKPNPGMLRTAARRHHLDLAKSWMIGDRESDVQTGQNAGVAVTVLVDDGSAPTAATYRVPDMEACADLLRCRLPAYPAL
ncbi:MAG TPA: HAD family hydrolase [Kiritimatiellia bacterium]|jgi:histidinol-phosphate phosphatase family protein|nr:HAD family hydrolase [Kiritimatiellia bacterium]